MPDTYLVVVAAEPPPLQVLTREPEQYSVSVSQAPGPPGPTGPQGPAGQVLVHDQPSPAGSWLIPHTFGRWPDVAVYSVTGDRIEPDITAGDTTVTISFSTPTAGKAVLL